MKEELGLKTLEEETGREDEGGTETVESDAEVGADADGELDEAGADGAEDNGAMDAEPR